MEWLVQQLFSRFWLASFSPTENKTAYLIKWILFHGKRQNSPFSTATQLSGCERIRTIAIEVVKKRWYTNSEITL